MGMAPKNGGNPQDRLRDAMNERVSGDAPAQAWPALPLEEWAETYHTLHMWLQMVGKIRLQQTAKQNHWWNSALYVTSRGLTTSLMPYGNDGFEIQLDFVDHRLNILTSDRVGSTMKLAAKSVRAFYRELMAALDGCGISVAMNTKPQEVADRFRSNRTISMPPTILSTPTGSGAYLSRRSSCWTCSEPGL